ncbi:hypothetical protein E2C05_09850 [Paracraurococcus ruber]|uniref:Lipoprotein n=1 Tax=Paracraurococcus ruber TaxID=77675 RepID=A0ABS1CYF5_9PROT|nr:hypothetical protein [Paracraurococcus ruber]MBK1659241.1 hypothetical protein [Paracraurococcus ruber]TDG31761.1 hypothetical protein E2C05_09850 [Paracraurococcus ruber]
MIRRAIVATGALAALAGCQQPQQAAGPAGARVYYADTQGAASVCEAPRSVALAAGQQAEAAMTVKNDGGWCGITVALSGKPYDAGLLVGRPEHGRVHVRKVGDATRVDYIPDAGFGGEDRFTVRFLPGNPALRVMVNVQYTPPPAPPAPPAPPPRTPARRR